MSVNEAKTAILNNKTALGIEFGSTRIKAVLVDDDISIVGSYNLDMRSTYLDTELMLVIESPELNEQIRATENIYMEKSKEIRSDGQEKEGSLYEKKILNQKKQMFYSVLRIFVRPFRHLL